MKKLLFYIYIYILSVNIFTVNAGVPLEKRGSNTSRTPVNVPPYEKAPLSHVLGHCGKKYGSCISGLCCSKNGECGITSSHCDKGCQSEYGFCYPNESSESTNVPTNVPPYNKAPLSFIPGICGPLFGSCKKGLCCSRYGFCGITSSHCGNGCQPKYGYCYPTSPSLPKEHSITVNTDGNGSITEDIKSAAMDTKIKLTTKANNGYILDKVSGTYNDGKGNDKANFEINVENDILTFVMPDGDVTINLSFINEEKPEPGTIHWDYGTLKYLTPANEATSGTNNGITLTTSYRSKAGGNLYERASNTFSVPDGYSITQIEFATTSTNCSSGSFDSGSVSLEDYTFYSTQDKKTVNGKKVFWTGNAQSVSFKCKAYGVEYVNFTISEQ